MSVLPELTDRAEAVCVRRDGSREDVVRSLVREHRVTVFADGAPFAEIVCTRSELRCLVLGRLCTAGRISSAKDVEKLTFSETEERAEVRLRPNASGRGTHMVTDRSSWRSEDVFRLAAALREKMPLHDETLGVHGALLLHRGELVCCCEDIGRHNAVDKAVGAALERGIPPDECVLYSTGRIASDLVEKTAAAGVAVLVSRALPTAEAVKRAHALGVTLIGRAWEEQYEVFTQFDHRPDHVIEGGVQDEV